MLLHAYYMDDITDTVTENTCAFLAILYCVKAYTQNVFDLLVSSLLENHIKIFTEMSQTCIKIAF